MGWTSAGPAAETFTTSEMKNRLKIDSDITTDDTLVDDLVKAARQYVENYLDTSLINQVITEKISKWPSDLLKDYPNAIHLSVNPVVSVTSIAYLDADGASQTLASNQYVVDNSGRKTTIYPAKDVTWPEVYSQRNAITITYVAGHGATSATIPADLRQAVAMVCVDWYENRADGVRVQPTAAESIMNRRKYNWL